jgi:hypothetical protein
MRHVEFEYPEDREFFANLFADGDQNRLDNEFYELFDFRHQVIKRSEFSETREKLFAELIDKYGKKCQLHIHPDCSKEEIYEPDHILPLATNELNKKLRRMTGKLSKKVSAQNFGSNNIRNLTLACKRCNAFKKHRIIIPRSLRRNDLNIFPYRVEDEIFWLESGKRVLIPKYFYLFSEWNGAPIPNDYNGKAVIDWNGEPLFAELAVLRLFESYGWRGVWVDSYRREYRTGLPGVAEPTELPKRQKQLIDSIRTKTGRHGGCWDLLVWRDDKMIFLELKRSKKDRVQKSQILWLEKSFESGFGLDNFAFVEWNI